MVLLSTSFAYAGNATTENVELTLVEGKITGNAALQNLIEDYFGMREAVLDSKELTVKTSITEMNTMVASTNIELLAHETKRSGARDNMAEYHDVHIINSEVVPIVEKAAKIEKTGYEEAYEVDVYEWTWIEYNDGNNGPVDRMGYATDHKMTIVSEVNGGLKILENKYDDEMFTGVPQNPPVAEVMSENELMDFSDEEVLTPNSISTSSLNVNKIITYADKWVGRSIAPDDDLGIEGNYNPAYPNYAASDSDCANYVSQCLKAGGLPNDLNGDTTRNDTIYEWWYHSGTSSTTWRYVPSMISYFTQEGCAPIAATKANVYPGNPVLHYSTTKNEYNHVGICVGYNYNDVPIINAHTRDVYHVPYTYFISPKTMQIFTSNRLYKKPTSAEEITPSSTVQTDYTVLTGGNNIYYKIDHPTTSSYTLKLTADCSTADCHIYIYQQKRGDAYMYELEYGWGKDFWMSATMNPDYNYYIRCYADAISGNNGFTLGYQKVS